LGKFLDTFSEVKSSATDKVTKQVANFSLNSTYGKFGQKNMNIHTLLYFCLKTNKLLLLVVFGLFTIAFAIYCVFYGFLSL
jgi:hypothetical protein